MQILLPEWQPPAGADPGLVKRWSNFMAALQTHEHGHEQIAVDAGHHLADALSQAAPAATCDQFDAAAKQTIQAIVAQNESDQKELRSRDRSRRDAGRSLSLALWRRDQTCDRLIARYAAQPVDGHGRHFASCRRRRSIRCRLVFHP